MGDIASVAKKWSLRVNWLVERICVLLLVLLVLDVWLGVLVRYVIPLPLTFTEELARYLMIWMALLAVSSAIAIANISASPSCSSGCRRRCGADWRWRST
jgi:TRAP-type C4-dicarboxylate transport system permease small subunit